MAAKDVDGGARLVISAKPKSSKEGVSTKDGVVIVRVSAAPEDGKASARVVVVVAAALGVPRSSVEIVRGETSRHKELLIRGVTAAFVDEKLSRLAQ
ncbi:MAG: DUF167 family protein [Deltaproteobacteria bacterium]|nr:DUF167 family protein [Deltaproteobacteria bacterium]